MILGGFEPEPIIVPDNMEDCHMEIINHRKERRPCEKSRKWRRRKQRWLKDQSDGASDDECCYFFSDPNIAGTSHGVGTLQHATEKRKNADISMEMYDSLCRSTNSYRRTEGPDRRDGLDITTSRALKDHIMVNRNSSTMNFTTI
jgi:hypothetical protein